jgi:hypothetical protein
MHIFKYNIFKVIFYGNLDKILAGLVEKLKKLITMDEFRLYKIHFSLLIKTIQSKG